MYKALGDFDGGHGFTELSFREPKRWASMSTANTNSRVAGTSLSSTAILLGDEQTGPALLFLALGPGVTPPDAPGHAHASDSWRMSLLGNLPMGPDRYDPGEFTFRQGWKPYASDNYAHGPAGGWTALMFGDRRGMRVRHVKHEGPDITPMDRMLAEWLGVEGDLVSVDPDDAPGASSMATTLDGQRRGARLNGSFNDTSHWRSFEGVDAVLGAIGDRETGPLVLLCKVQPGYRPLGGATIGSDVFRLVGRGSYTLDGREYVAGDMRVQTAGTPLGELIAGPDGVDEVVVIADRRSLASPAPLGDTWSLALKVLLEDLGERLAAV